MQAQVEDRLHLHFGQAIGAAFLLGARLDRLDQLDVGRDLADRPFAGQQRLARGRRVGRASDDLHHLVEVGDGNNQAQQDVRTVTRLVQFELGAAGDHFLAEADEAGDDVPQRQHFRTAAADRQHVGRERALRRGVAPQLVEHHFGGGIALEVDHHAHAKPARFIADVGNALDPLVLGGFGDLLDQAGLADLIGDRSQHDRPPVAPAFLDLVPAAHDDAAAPLGIGLARTGLAKDQRSSGEVRRGDDLDQLVVGDCRVLDRCQAGIDHFAQVVRWNVGRHADRDPAGAIDQQVGEARRQDGRLLARTVIVVGEIDRILVEIFEQGIGDPGEPRFGITHRGRRIGIHRAEVALAIDQRQPHRPVLGHARQRVVDRGVAMRVIVAHHVADDLGALAIGPPGDETAFLAGEENAAVDRLQPVAHIRQRTADDHAHRVIEVAGLHFVDDVDTLEFA